MRLTSLAMVGLTLLGCGAGDVVTEVDVDVSEDSDLAPDTHLDDTVLPDTSHDTSDTSHDTTHDTSDTGPDTGDTSTSDTASDVADTFPDTADAADAVDTSDTPDTSDTSDTSDTVTPETTTPDTSPACTPSTQTHPVVPSEYVPVCSEVSYATDPPTSGPHYPVWATYKTYIVPINPGFLVHSLKHGAIVITWSCPEGCAADLVALREMLNDRPADPRCDPLLHHRIIVAPRPGQDKKLVAWAWGASWKADCFDLAGLNTFIDASYGKGLEDDCFDGVDVEKIRPGNPWYCPP